MSGNRIIALGLCAATALTVFLGGCFIYIGDGYQGAEAHRSEELTAPLTDITALDVSTHVGTIRVEAGDVTEATIAAKITVKAKTDEKAEALLEEVRISAEPSDHTLVVKAVKPSDFGHSGMVVDFTITVPMRLDVHCRTSVGDIRITGLAGDVVAKSDVGKIDCADLHGGEADLVTNVGAIKATYAGDAPAALQVNAATNVGDIDFSGPDRISAKFSAVTNVGDIHTDREMTVKGQFGKSLNASLYSGEGKITFRTNVGSIKIR